MCFICTLIWCVLPVTSRHLTSEYSFLLHKTLYSVTALLPVEEMAIL